MLAGGVAADVVDVVRCRRCRRCGPGRRFPRRRVDSGHGTRRGGRRRRIARARAGAFRVLLVENNLTTLDLVERVLSRRPGTEVLAAMQGGLGVDLAREHVPDMILLDLSLPDMTGDVVLDRLAEDPATADIPVAVIGADAPPQQVRQLLRARRHRVPGQAHRRARALVTRRRGPRRARHLSTGRTRRLRRPDQMARSRPSQ